MNRIVMSVGLFIAVSVLSAAEEPKWEPMLGTFPKTEKAGFGGLCGFCVDRSTGDIIVNISDRGFYKSTDGAKTFKRISETQPNGRTETPGCFLIDPTGKTKTLLTALVYGPPASWSDDGAAWKPMSEKVKHIDWCAVDWTDPERKFVLALKHESGDMLLASQDGGKTFREIGKGYGPGWVFNATTAVVAQAKTKDRPKPGLVRTDDGGTTWTPCDTHTPAGSASARTMPRWHDDVLYWLVEGALISTDDMGKTWKTICELKDGKYGPVFGKTAKHMFVLTSKGVIETTDGGAIWSAPISTPAEVKRSGLAWLDYDPKSDSLFVMCMGSDLYKLARGR
jgi:photosystem II stability/assembly factor-like uncharacterized protein